MLPSLSGGGAETGFLFVVLAVCAGTHSVDEAGFKLRSACLWLSNAIIPRFCASFSIQGYTLNDRMNLIFLAVEQICFICLFCSSVVVFKIMIVHILPHYSFEGVGSNFHPGNLWA